MKKRVISVALLVPALWAAAKTPNVIYIMTDQQSANAMSCAGNPDLRTPAMDRLAARGVRFSNAYCALPLSGPTRAAMFTGLMPSQCGMMENETPLPDSLKNRTLGNLMEEAGYRGAYAGKWHVNTNALPAAKAFGFERLHGHDDRGLAEAVVEFLRGDRGDRPFFLVASFDNPHNVCQYARGQRLPEAEIPEPASVADCPNLPANHLDQPYDPDILRWEREQSYRLYPTKGYTPDDWRRYRNTYFRLVEHVDAEIGKIVDEIDRQNLWDNTVVIFTSDHGDGQGAHQWNQKTALWEETANIPLIVCAPGNARNAGKVSEALVNNAIDLMPSVLDWAGEGKPSWCKGASFRYAVERPEAETAQPFVVTETDFAQTGGTKGWLLRTPRYKYVLYEAGTNREALYDMANDRLEMRNLAIESAYKPVVEEHRRLLSRWFDENPKGLPYSRQRFIPVN
ncbi:MAG: sulfatase-like hydrolase/transferase [Muribaculaceae bacterium]|nr:sulfatase-like hydrolase/transferase [Muribaculaceae bacterium]MDE7142436.1 sulfatase-like hydrolase/transferase [Muribaculaceae bacterium]